MCIYFDILFIFISRKLKLCTIGKSFYLQQFITLNCQRIEVGNHTKMYTKEICIYIYIYTFIPNNVHNFYIIGDLQ